MDKVSIGFFIQTFYSIRFSDEWNYYFLSNIQPVTHTSHGVQETGMSGVHFNRMPQP